MEIKFLGIDLIVIPDKDHGWLLPMKTAADVYGVSVSSLSYTRMRHADEFEENADYVYRTVKSTSNRSVRMLFATKRGMVSIGSFIKSPMGRKFRKMAVELAAKSAVTQSFPFLIPGID